MDHITETTLYDIFSNVYDNWHHIKMNDSVMSVIDMKTNNLCKCLKLDDPMLLDETIQQRVLSFLLSIISLMCRPSLEQQNINITTIDNVDNLGNNYF